MSREFLFERIYFDSIEKSIYAPNFEGQVFIPANRTFISILPKNIFSFLASNIDIDYFLTEFGSTLEQAKRFLNSHLLVKDQSIWKNVSILKATPPLNEAFSIMEGIIAGKYLDENEQDWIVSTAGKINLAHASSGQQESLPMLLVLCVLPFAFIKSSVGFFIEEPEAHLFPVSRKALISLLALIANKSKHQFFITTHSPYLLTALNNCIIAYSTYESVDQAGKQKVLEIMPQHQHIAFADVSAWTVTEKGTIKSILDEQAKIIGVSILDGVSQHFETVTNELLDILYEGQSL